MPEKMTNRDTKKQPDDEEAGREIGPTVRRLRLEQDLSLSQLEASCGVSKGHLSLIENGHTQPSIETLRKITDVLGIGLAELLGEDADAPIAERELPRGLAEFVAQAESKGMRIARTDIEMLRDIKYRGKQPKRAEDWAHLYELIRRDAPNWSKG